MQACVSTCGHADMCWYVPTCASMWNHSQHLWYQPFETYLACWHVSAHLDMPICACMCWHVPTCDINLDTSDSSHLDLIWMLACVSICGHADMCWHVPTCDINLDTSYSDQLDLIWMLACVSICGHAGMCWNVPACANMWNHSQHEPFETYLAYWHVSANLDMPICADMCRHVLTCANMWH